MLPVKDKLLKWNILTLIALKVIHGLLNQNKATKDRKSMDISDRKGINGEKPLSWHFSSWNNLIYQNLKGFVTLNICNKGESERLNRLIWNFIDSTLNKCNPEYFGGNQYCFVNQYRNFLGNLSKLYYYSMHCVNINI